MQMFVTVFVTILVLAYVTPQIQLVPFTPIRSPSFVFDIHPDEMVLPKVQKKLIGVG